jgi:hypothetical protein
VCLLRFITQLVCVASDVLLCRFGIRYVYCWHGLPAYWGGVMPGTPSLAGLTGSSLVYPKPTSSIAEVEPSLMWSPAVLAGAHPKVCAVVFAVCSCAGGCCIHVEPSSGRCALI